MPSNVDAPRRLGRYRLRERLAVGGMAEVYKAVAEGLSGFEKTVVVKRLLPQHRRDQELLTMFVDEARLLGRLRHPNIAEVYDIACEGDEYFFALAFIDGVDLRALLDDNEGAPLPLEEALWIVREVARALAYAHDLCDEDGRPLGIVHRDVTPSNVLIETSGAVKLVDFGVAKWRAQRSETRHGVLKGKVNYMSPEQCRGEPLDHRSDVFALGVMLYVLTVGDQPFAAPSDFETLKAIAEGRFASPSERRPGYPAPLEAIVQGALALAPQERTPDMHVLAAQLTSVISDDGFARGAAGLALRAGRMREARTAKGGPCPSPAPFTALRPVTETLPALAAHGPKTATESLSGTRRRWLWLLFPVGMFVAVAWLWSKGPSSAPPQPALSGPRAVEAKPSSRRPPGIAAVPAAAANAPPPRQDASAPHLAPPALRKARRVPRAVPPPGSKAPPCGIPIPRFRPDSCDRRNRTRAGLSSRC